MNKALFYSLLFIAPLVAYADEITFYNPLGAASFGRILSKVLIIAMSLGAVVLTILIVIAAYTLMISKGDPGEIKKAKSTILYGVIGYVILLFAEAIRRIIENLLAS